MSGLDRPAAQIQRRAVDLFDAEQPEPDAGADDVGNRIERSDFVEVNLLDRHLMNGGFDLS